MNIRKNDKVHVLTGRDKDKEGVVIDIFPKKGKVVIQGLGMAVRHAKQRKASETAGIKKIETLFDISNVMPVCPACKKPSRVNGKVTAEGKKVRSCNRCEEVF